MRAIPISRRPLRAVPAPLRTLMGSLVAVSACAVLALLLQIVAWITANPLHILLVAGIAGAVVIAMVRRHHGRSPIPTGPHREATPTRTTTKTPKTTTRTPTSEIAYYAGRRIGIKTADGRVQLDNNSHRAG
jgi:hypothetical protein